MNHVLKHHRLKTALVAGLAGSLLLGGCASTDEAQENANSGFTGVTSAPAEQEASKYPFPSNGLKDDGYGVYQQSTIADDDPALEVSRSSNLIVPDVWDSGYTEEDIQEAQKFVLTFVSTEGIDSTLRAPRNGDNQQRWEQWVSENRHWFADEVEFVMDNKHPSYIFRVSPHRLIRDGWPNDTIGSGSSDWKEETRFEYAYGEETMRVTNRTFTPGEIRLSGAYKTAPQYTNPLTFEGLVSYALEAKINGTDGWESDRDARYWIDVARDANGEWKILGVNLYGSQD